jgi:hypothetical protein
LVIGIGPPIRGFCLTVVLLAAATSRAEATSITIDAIGDAFSVDFAGVIGTGGHPLSVSSEWRTTSLTATSVTFQVTLLNTSETDRARLTGLEFKTDLDALSGSAASLLFPFVSVADLSGFQFDGCITDGDDGANSCTSNGGNLGLGVRDPSETFLLTLYFSDTSGGISFSDFGARLHIIGPRGTASTKIPGDPIPFGPECVGCDLSLLVAIPEPATLLLVGGGGALALRRRVWERVRRFSAPS